MSGKFLEQQALVILARKEKERIAEEERAKRAAAWKAAQRGYNANRGENLEESYYVEEEVEATKDTYDLEEEEYIEFLKQYGEQDFSLIYYTPKLKSVKEWQDEKKERFQSGAKVIRTQTLIGNNFDVEKETMNGRLRLVLKPKDIRKKNSKQEQLDAKKGIIKGMTDGDLSLIPEAMIEQTIDDPQDHKLKKKNQKDKQKSELEIIEDDENKKKAQRFDFTFLEHFYKHNIRIDEYGERITSYAPVVARIVTQERLSSEYERTNESSEYAYYDEQGKLVQQPKDIPVIPVEELEKVYYFQYRIDKIYQNTMHPKIIYGVCRQTFKLTIDVNRAEDAYCLNLATGDIMFNRKWKEYYEVDAQPEPRFGHFREGTIIGCQIDMERGVISFYKDGQDLGQAFVANELKYGDFFPFIQTNEEVSLSIFHPFVYPCYRPPKKAEKPDLKKELLSVQENSMIIPNENSQSFGDDEPLRKKNKQNTIIVENVDQKTKSQEQEKKKSVVIEEKRSSQVSEKRNAEIAALRSINNSKVSKNDQKNESDVQNKKENENKPIIITNGFRGKEEEKKNQRHSNQQLFGENSIHQIQDMVFADQNENFDDESFAQNKRDSNKSNKSQKEEFNFNVLQNNKKKDSREEKQYQSAKDQIMQDMRKSQDYFSANNSQIVINNREVDLNKIDMKKLASAQEQDQQRLSQLQQEYDNLQINMTLAHEDNMSQRGTVLSNSEQANQINNIQYEIEKYQKEIELLRLKLQFKKQIISYKQTEKERKTAGGAEEDPCTIF